MTDISWEQRRAIVAREYANRSRLAFWISACSGSILIFWLLSYSIFGWMPPIHEPVIIVILLVIALVGGISFGSYFRDVSTTVFEGGFGSERIVLEYFASHRRAHINQL